MTESDLPVFTDTSGRRWRRATRASAAAGLATLVLLAVGAPDLLHSPLEPAGGPGVSTAQVGADAVGVGSGPLVRVAAVDGDVLLDPFTGTRVGRLTADEREALGTDTHALQYYGYLPQSGLEPRPAQEDEDPLRSEASGRVVQVPVPTETSPSQLLPPAAGPAVAPPSVPAEPEAPAAEERRPTLSLTFDDGPDEVWTPQVLDVLSRYGAQSTFFVNGSNLVRHPELAERAQREGHLVANHTVGHEDLATVRGWKQRWELVVNDHALRGVLGEGSSYVRLPYDGGEGAEFVEAVLSAQARGYDVSTYDFDSMDWFHVQDADAIEMPELDGRDLTMLLHDAGGDRSATVAYLERLLPAAQQAGYVFTTLETAQPTPAQATAAAQPATLADTLAVRALQAAYVWPENILRGLFVLALGTVAVVGLIQLVLGVVRYRRRRAAVAALVYDQPVDVVVAAYNEEQVIARTLESVLSSRQELGRVVVVDDGSTDATAAVVLAVAARDPRVQLVQQANGGKSSAQNNGLRHARNEVVVTLDADTVIDAETISTLTRHYAGPDAETLGAVAGTVKVGNRTRNLLTRWQALEYVVQIGVERAAQDSLGAISIIPGACAAWRREAILAAGGYSHDTLAEDCDLSLSLHSLGFRVTQDDESVARTEAPDTVDALLKQRTRWMYGTMQAVVKHRRMVFDPRAGWLGMFVLPAYVLSLVVPLLFLPVVAVVTVLLLQQDDGLATAAPYFLSFLAVQLVITVAGIKMMRESWHHLWMVALYRVVFEVLRAYLIYVCAYTAIRGGGLSWNKLARTGFLDEVGIPAQRRAEESVRVPQALS